MLFVPPLFVVLWATGFVTARLVAPHIEPMTFLFLRFALAASALTLLALASRAPWPRTPREWGVAAAIGLLLQGIYLGGVFWAVKHGLPAAVCSLVVSTQPLLISLAPALFSASGSRSSDGSASGSAFSGWRSSSPRSSQAPIPIRSRR